MGKIILTPFADVNERIIKRGKKASFQFRKEHAYKRKCSNDSENPVRKIPRLDNTDKENKPPIREDISTETVYAYRLDSSFILNTREQVMCDLFFNDELKNSCSNFIGKDIYFHIVDEIALEGLDGVTIEAFWKRLSTALEGPLNIDENMQNFIWQNVIISLKHFEFFKLPTERRELEIYNLFDYMHTEIGVVMELAYEVPDIYTCAPVSSPVVFGSCANFNDRIDISQEVRDLSIKQAEKTYGRTLVIVGDQSIRTFALCGELADPSIEFLNMEYCILERVARSRKLGELTQGNLSLSSAFKMDSKSVFHYKKMLSQNDLISKQVFVIKSAILDHNKSGSLIHLKRFYTNIRSRQSCMADQVINVLRNQPNYTIDSRRLRQIFADNIFSVSKLLKNPEFKKFVKSKLCPYRHFFPSATPSEYRRKSARTEKSLIGYELINPYVNVSAYWRAGENDDSDIEDEPDEELEGHKMYKTETIREIYYYIFSKKDEGCSGLEIRKSIAVDKNTARIALNKLLGKALIDFKKFDSGKQRKYMYKARCWKKPDTPTTSSKPATTTVKTSSIKLKMLERQKAAQAKKRQECLSKPHIIQTVKSSNVNPFLLKLDVNHISDCSFLVKQNITEIMETTSPFSPNINISNTYTIPLTYIYIQSEDTFKINHILMEIDPRSELSEIRTDGCSFYSYKCSSDKEIKLILLRAAWGDRNATKDLLDIPKDKTNERLTLTSLDKSKSVNSIESKLNYMGANPVLVFQDNSEGVKTEIHISTVPPKYRYETEYPVSETFTERVHGRIQYVLDLINEMKIIVEIFFLNNLILEKEKQSGDHQKIDRKSVLRILKQLVKDGFIKVYKLVLKNDTISKTVAFVCHPSINYTHDDIQNTIQQLKWKHFFSVAKTATKPNIPKLKKTIEDKFASSPFSQADVLNSIKEMKALGKNVIREIKRKFNTKIGKVYGSKPKFTRMRILHEFLFFLIYESTGNATPLSIEEVDKLFRSYRILPSEHDLAQLPKVYHDEISWKMFIPPLPDHPGWPQGWALICDIILRIPVSILLKVHNCCYEDQALLDILNHPIKRFYLVKDLPERTRKTVLFRRKYLCSIYYTVYHLVFCGLLQFGPQKYREKDQIFIYLNRSASIVDTTSSAAGYNEIENKEYPKLSFHFTTHLDVESYWQKLSTISLMTKLGTREVGKLITLVYLNSKPEIVESVKSRTPEEAKKNDNGFIPGDGKGASGLDSSMWSHLVRNWFYTKGNTECSLYTDSYDLKEFPKQVVPFKDYHLTPTKVYLPSKSRDTFRNTKKSKKVFQWRRTKRKSTVRRTIQQRKQKAKREYNDCIDKKILKKLQGSRVRWSPEEDNILYLLKIVDMFLSSDKVYTKQMVAFPVVRDVLHRVSEESKNKTARAIQRRWNKSKDIYRGLEDCIPNLLKIGSVRNTFGLLLSKINTMDVETRQQFKLTEKQLSAVFVIFASYILHNRQKVKDVLYGNLINHDHLCDENLKNTEENLIEVEKKDKKYEDPKSQDDIRMDVLKSVIHSSLCSKNESVNLTSRLLKIYQNYPDALLREAVRELRVSNLMTYKKWRDRQYKIWDTPFSLSQYYIFFQYSTFSIKTAEEAYTCFLSIIHDHGKSFESNENKAQKQRYGQLLSLNEFFTYFDVIDFDFNLPQSTVRLNPQIENHEQLVEELALRYHMKLRSLQNVSNDSEIELDEDSERLKQMQEVDDEKHTLETAVQKKLDTHDPQTNPLDLTFDSGSSETIDRLKTWITDRVQDNMERRSPSPEFTNWQTEATQENDNEYQSDVGAQRATETRKNFIAEKSSGQIPTLDEIKTGMLKVYSNNEERAIPYITDLSYLLKESFADLKTTEESLTNFKAHFLTEYTTLNKITISEEDMDSIKDHYIVNYINDSTKNERLWEKIENEIIVKDFLSMPDFKVLILKDGGTEEDIQVASDIIEFASSKTFFGATGSEIRAMFLHREKNSTLETIVRNLIKAGILIQVGICTLSFVHYIYQYIWVVPQEVNSDIKEESLERSKSRGMKVMPWVTVNGTLNKTTFTGWLGNVLSHCLDYPKISFTKLCEKFRYLKQVDLYFLIQILDELGCIELYVYDLEEESLFSEWTLPKKRRSSLLDNLNDIIIQPNSISMTSLGSFVFEDANHS